MPEARLAGNWLASYLDYTSKHEAPESIHLWTGLVCISAALRRRIYVDLEYGKIFSNIYVIIVAESAKVRKSVAMDIGRDLLIEALPDLRIMRDSMTSQGLIKSLNHKVQVVKDDKISEELRSDVAIFADEVANLFSYERTRSAQMVIFLTRTYTCPGFYDHTTVRDSMVRLHNLYPVLLGGTDPHNLKVFPEDAVGGLTGRLIWVIENRRRANNSGWKGTDREILKRKLQREWLIHDLQMISQLQGEMLVEPDAMEFYDDWYDKLSKKDSKDPETDAFYQRCHTTALRVAQLLSVAERDDLVVTLKHTMDAIVLIEKQLPEVKRVTMWSGTSHYEQGRAKFISFLQKSPAGAATRRILLKHMGMPAEEFDKLVLTLIQDGSLETPIRVGADIALRLTREGYGVVIVEPSDTPAPSRLAPNT